MKVERHTIGGVQVMSFEAQTVRDYIRGVLDRMHVETREEEFVVGFLQSAMHDDERSMLGLIAIGRHKNAENGPPPLCFEIGDEVNR